ncbi:MAG: Hsp20/alpha crystallin family protein [Bdellovibrionales bacterium]|nr:Hsp20/alpha crystallin family protein [Bdellovibrionales bacterium]
MANLSLFRSSPFRDLNRLQRQIDRIFDEFSTSWNEELMAPSWGHEVAFRPACEVQETDSHYLLSLDLPGVKKEDIKVELLGSELVVSGQRKEEHEAKTATSYQMERSYGSFSRAFTVPQGTKPEQVETDYQNGVLRIAVPKLEAAKTHKIMIGEKPGLFQRLLGHKKEEAGKAKTGEKVA